MAPNARFWALTAIASLIVLRRAGPSPIRSHRPRRAGIRCARSSPWATRIAKWRQAKDEAAKEAQDAALRPILGQARLGLQEIPPGRGDQVRFVRAVLNGTGAGFDAVRFRTPATGEEFQLLWEIVVPGNDYTRTLQAWNCVGVDGPAPVAEYFSRRDSFDLPGSGFPEENYCVSPYPGRPPLRPDSEYILWFDFTNDRAVPAFVKVRLTPAEETTSRVAGAQRAQARSREAGRSTSGTMSK